jgi:hypothetical protein
MVPDSPGKRFGQEATDVSGADVPDQKKKELSAFCVTGKPVLISCFIRSWK